MKAEDIIELHAGARLGLNPQSAAIRGDYFLTLGDTISLLFPKPPKDLQTTNGDIYFARVLSVKKSPFYQLVAGDFTGSVYPAHGWAGHMDWFTKNLPAFSQYQEFTVVGFSVTGRKDPSKLAALNKRTK